MSETEIPVGRELDKAVAFRVLGWTWEPCERPTGWLYGEDEPWRLTKGPGTSVVLPGRWRDSDGQWHNYPLVPDDLPEFSTDMGAAWQVVEHLRKHRCGWSGSQPSTGGCCVTFWGIGAVGESDHVPSMPEAICRAALRLVEAWKTRGVCR